MENYKDKTGVTLVEMLVVVFIVALLASTVISIATRIDNQGKERMVEGTFALLDAALGQFRDHGYCYKEDSSYSNQEKAFYQRLDFPLDCSDFDQVGLEAILTESLDRPISINASDHDPKYSGSEALYFFLSRVPASRKTLEGIDESQITNKGSNKQEMKITVDGEEYSLLRIIDPWGETLRYDYYAEEKDEPDLGKREKGKRSFPLITSAGPDRKFDTDDDITNK